MTEPTEVQDHWWWRPGWRKGRHFYACHLTFEQASELHELVKTYQNALAPVSNLDMIPLEWLHLTMQGIGFVDDVSDNELSDIRQAIADQVSKLQPFVVSFSYAVVRPEAIYLPAERPDSLVTLHNILGQAIASVIGDARSHRLPEQASGYRPHVSVAYVNKNGPAMPIRSIVDGLNVPAVEIPVSEVPILTFHRDERMYVWTRRDPIMLGG